MLTADQLDRTITRLDELRERCLITDHEWTEAMRQLWQTARQSNLSAWFSELRNGIGRGVTS